MKYRLTVVLLIIMSLPLSAVFCHAAAVEDSPLLCAINEVIECAGLGECAELAAEDVGLPDFFIIDLGARKLREASSVSLRESSFAAHSPVEGVIILSGVDGLRGWSAVLSQDNTRLTASVSDERAAFVVFGHCRAQP